MHHPQRNPATRRILPAAEARPIAAGMDGARHSSLALPPWMGSPWGVRIFRTGTVFDGVESGMVVTGPLGLVHSG